MRVQHLEAENQSLKARVRSLESENDLCIARLRNLERCIGVEKLYGPGSVEGAMRDCGPVVDPDS